MERGLSFIRPPRAGAELLLTVGLSHYEVPAHTLVDRQTSAKERESSKIHASSSHGSCTHKGACFVLLRDLVRH